MKREGAQDGQQNIFANCRPRAFSLSHPIDP
jgi:hypothetical protein